MLASVGGVCKVFLHGLSDTKITGAGHFEDALQRPAGQALLTVSNHVAAADDPALTAALLPAKYLLDQKALRWTMCATDRCFTSPTMIPFFRAAKVSSNEESLFRCEPADIPSAGICGPKRRSCSGPISTATLGNSHQTLLLVVFEASFELRDQGKQELTIVSCRPWAAVDTS